MIGDCNRQENLNWLIRYYQTKYIISQSLLSVRRRLPMKSVMVLILCRSVAHPLAAPVQFWFPDHKAFKCVVYVQAGVKCEMYVRDMFSSTMECGT